MNSNNLDLGFYIYFIAFIKNFKINNLVVFKILKFRGQNKAKLLYFKKHLTIYYVTLIKAVEYI